MREIIECSFIDYIFLFGNFRTSFSDYSVKNSLESGGIVYMVIENNETAGLLCIQCEGNMSVIPFAVTIEKYRRRGIFSYMLSYAVKQWNKPLKLSVATDNNFFEIISHVCINQGFVHDSFCTVYRGKSEDFIKWEEYMLQKGDKLCAMLKRQGYLCVSFTELDNILIDKIYNSSVEDFGNKLDVRPFFDNPQKKMSMDMSFVAIKDGELAAYTLTSRPDEHSVIFEHISVSEKHIGSGCILLPFSKSMEMFKKNKCRRAAYAMYETNIHANKFRQKLLKTVTSSKQKSENYILKK